MVRGRIPLGGASRNQHASELTLHQPGAEYYPYDVLVIDNSGSMYSDGFEPNTSKLDLVHHSVMHEYLQGRKNLGYDTWTAVVCFDNKASLCCDFTSVRSDAARIGNAFDQVRDQGGGGTRMETGLQVALELLQQATGPHYSPGAYPARVIALSDGQDQKQAAGIDIACQIKELGCLIETVGVEKTPEAVSEDFLRSVATTDQRGTHYRFLGSGQAIRQTFERLGVGVLTISDMTQAERERYDLTGGVADTRTADYTWFNE